MRRAGSGLTDPDATKNKLDNYARVAQHALKWQASPVHWRGLNRAIIGYCTQNKQPVPDWKGCGFTQLKPFLMHLAGQNRIRFVGDHIVHPDNEDGSVDIVGYDEDENSEDADESIVPAQLNRSTSSTVVTHAKAISSPKLNKSSSFSKSAASSGKLVPCPVCQSMMAEEEVNRHLDECLNLQMLNNEQNGANNAASNTAAVPNTNPRTTAAVAAGTLLSQLTGADEDEVVNLAHTRRGHRGAAIHLGKRRRSAPGGRAFAPNKRARIFYENHEEDEDSSHSGDSEEEAQEEDRLVNNNNNRLRFVPEVQQNIPAVPVNNQTHHVHLSDDSDDEDNANNAQGGGDSRFAEKILDRTLADKECIICYMAMEKGQLVVTMPCFCQFHKECLLDWFSKREVCPTHSEMSM